MLDTMKGLKRTHYCGEVEGIGSTVTVAGFVQRVRDKGSLMFVDLRDRTGIVQLVFDDTTEPAVFEKAKQIKSEYVLMAQGLLRERESKNNDIKTGNVEILVTDLRILSMAQTTPFEIVNDTKTNEELRLKYRYLDLRRKKLQDNLIMRHRIAKTAREYFYDNGFLEIETPMMMKSTPEGARDYLVPSRVHEGKFYALPQSPQIYKQLLMISGFDRYIQLARCFRDEDLRADRQPEFTQIDLEMSFMDVDEILELTEGFIKKLMKDVLDVDITIPLPRLTYNDAMSRYGSDKPDTRFGLEFVNVSDIVKDCGFGAFADAVKGGGSVRCINVEGGVEHFTRKQIDAFGDLVKTYRAKGLAWLSMKPEGIQCSFAKFLTEDQIKAILERANAKTGDILFFVADAKDTVVYQALGALRLELGRRLGLMDDTRFNFLWVIEFPQFEWSEEDGRYYAMHHPFTSPMDEDLDLLDTDQGKVRAKAYDIVLNGNEIGGGSIRIHSPEVQEKMFEKLGFTKEEAWERFGFLMGAFKYGTPPHGGLAYGLDRLAMLITRASSIRDVIAFPKVQTASCLMSGCPDVVEQAQLEELHIETVADKE